MQLQVVHEEFGGGHRLRRRAEGDTGRGQGEVRDGRGGQHHGAVHPVIGEPRHGVGIEPHPEGEPAALGQLHGIGQQRVRALPGRGGRCGCPVPGVPPHRQWQLHVPTDGDPRALGVLPTGGAGARLGDTPGAGARDRTVARTHRGAIREVICGVGPGAGGPVPGRERERGEVAAEDHRVVGPAAQGGQHGALGAEGLQGDPHRRGRHRVRGDLDEQVEPVRGGRRHGLREADRPAQVRLPVGGVDGGQGAWIVQHGPVDRDPRGARP